MPTSRASADAAAPHALRAVRAPAPACADIWDTAGQERFNSMHASYYYRAHACIMVFDVTRKVTYKNLDMWYAELQEHCKGIPTIVVANKIDIDYKVCVFELTLRAEPDMKPRGAGGAARCDARLPHVAGRTQVTSKSFAFASKHKLPFFFVSASDGTNVVKIFQMAIRSAIQWKATPKEDFYQEVRRTALHVPLGASAHDGPALPRARRLGRRAAEAQWWLHASRSHTAHRVHIRRAPQVLDLLGEISVETKNALEAAVKEQEDKDAAEKHKAAAGALPAPKGGPAAAKA